MSRQMLRGRIVERYGTIMNFCKEIGISGSTATAVLTGDTTPKRGMMTVWCQKLGIEQNEIGAFFYPETSEN